ncbi:glycosyltransferase [Salinisphaera aquimarina]|uniref:Glycosyltransferase n=1 Tax=Salinisphaera aquimarina TaxID=2094031 RepID=A0ABV7ERB1_9GAMM
MSHTPPSDAGLQDFTPEYAPILVISPVRDEADYIELTLESMRNQRIRPAEWIIVDDGSVDATRELVKVHADAADFIHLVKKPDRGFRQVGSGVIEAFKYGLAQARRPDYEYIVKLDGDVSFGSHYIARMLAAFERNPQLAAVSGKVFRPEAGGLEEERLGDDMVTGQFKFYRRTAFEAIGGFEQTIQWDGIDIHRCRMLGWATGNIDDPDAVVYHHRLMGSSQASIYQGRLRWGHGIYFIGYHPLYAFASGVFRMREKPYVIGGLLIIAGYLRSTLQSRAQYPDPAFRKSLRAWQRQRLRQLLGKVVARLIPFSASRRA